MRNIIAHIIGLDEIHKKKLERKLPKHIKIIDLDEIQQKIYNSSKIAAKKNEWTSVSKDIIQLQKQKKIIGSQDGGGAAEIIDQIKKLMAKRNSIRQEIHQLWKDGMAASLNNYINEKDHYLLLGFNIFPKDYRVKINLDLECSLPNKLIYDIKPAKYAANQIKFYLDTYSDRIIRGVFPLNLLNVNYLINKYEKFSEHYYKQNYQLADDSKILELIKKLDSNICNIDQIADKYVYIATAFKSGDTIPVNSKIPIEGFLNKNDAIAFIQPQIKNNGLIYLYKIKADQFTMTNGKLIATKEIYPIDEESIIMS